MNSPKVIAAGPQADVIIASGYSERAIGHVGGATQGDSTPERPGTRAARLSIRTFGDSALVQKR